MGKKEFEFEKDKDSGNPSVIVTDYLDEDNNTRRKKESANKVLKKAKVCSIVTVASAFTLVLGVLSTVASGTELDFVEGEQQALKTKIKSSDSYYNYLLEKQAYYRNAYNQGFYTDEEYVNRLDGLAKNDSLILSGHFDGCDEEYNVEAMELNDDKEEIVDDLGASLIVGGAGFVGVIAGISAYPSPGKLALVRKQKEEELCD